MGKSQSGLSANHIVLIRDRKKRKKRKFASATSSLFSGSLGTWRLGGRCFTREMPYQSPNWLYVCRQHGPWVNARQAGVEDVKEKKHEIVISRWIVKWIVQKTQNFMNCQDPDAMRSKLLSHKLDVSRGDWNVQFAISGGTRWHKFNLENQISIFQLCIALRYPGNGHIRSCVINESHPQISGLFGLMASIKVLTLIASPSNPGRLKGMGQPMPIEALCHVHVRTPSYGAPHNQFARLVLISWIYAE